MSRLDRALEAAYAPEKIAALDGRFERGRILGRGGMGEVVVARDRVLDRRVALKLIRPELHFRAEARERFLREARIVSRFDHRNLCRLYDVFQAEGRDVLVLELIEGMNLQERHEAGLERREALRIAAAIAEGLSVAHGAGIVHRDVKPSNVMVTADGVVKILDFGIARSSDLDDVQTDEGSGVDGATPLTRAGQILGTPEYMSPEQRRGEPASAASDLYALGRILLDVLVPGDPSVGDQERWTGDRQLDRLIRSLLHPEPARRPGAERTAAELRAVLRRPRRRVAQLTAATAALLLVLGVSKYVVDLGRERDQVIERQWQAESLIDFLVGSVAPRLEAVGPAELIEELDVKALAYFSGAEHARFSDVERRRRVQALTGFAQRVKSHGRLTSARAIYDEAIILLDKGLDEDPNAEEWIFELSQLHFYVGEVLRDEGDRGGAWDEWSEYERLAQRLVEIDPTREAYRDELAWARSNMGVLALEGGQAKLARVTLRSVLDHWKDRSAAEPSETWLAQEVADALSWFAEASFASGDMEAAHDAFEFEVAGRQALLRRDPANTLLKHGLALAHYHLARVLERSGSYPEAREQAHHALRSIEALLAGDPSRGDWLRSRALSATLLAQVLDDEGDHDAAHDWHGLAVRTVEALTGRDPGNTDASQLYLHVKLAAAWNQAFRGDTDESLRNVQGLQSWGNLGGEGQLLRADARLLQGDLLADEEASRKLWRQIMVELGELESTLDEASKSRGVALRVRCLLRLGEATEAQLLAAELGRHGLLDPALRRELARSRSGSHSDDGTERGSHR